MGTYLVLGREGRSEAARTRGGGHPGVLDYHHDDKDYVEGDEVTMLVGKPSIFGLYLDKVKAVKGCRQTLFREGITPADVSFKI